MRKLIALFVVAASVVAAPSFAEVLTHHTAHVSIDVPENWKVKHDGDSITAMDKHEDVAVAFVVVPAGKIEKATEAAGHELEKSIKNLTWGKGKAIKINGMSGYQIEGDGRMDGKDIDVALVALDTPSKDKDLLVIAVAEDAKLAKHKSEVTYLFEHLKPVD